MSRSYQQRLKATQAAEGRLYRQAQRGARALTDRLAKRYGLLEGKLRQQWPRFIESRPVLAYQRRALADDISQWWQFLDPATQTDIEVILSRTIEASLELAQKRYPSLVLPSSLSTSGYVDSAMTAIGGALDRSQQRMVLTAAAGVEQGTGFSRVATLLRALMKRSNTEIQTITLTSAYTANQDAGLSMLQDDGIDLVQWMTMGDDRVCPTCAVRDMLVYRLDEIILPAHMRCRCQVMPVTLDELSDESLAADIGKYRQSTLDALQKAGRKTDHVLTSAEKYHGRKDTAKPIWRPGN